MVRTRVFPLFLAGVLAATGAWPASAWAQSRTSIIEYDKDGRPKGAITNEQNAVPGRPAPGAAPAARGAAPAAPAPRGPASRFAEGEVVVANAPAGFEQEATRMGFRLLERVRLGNLNMEILRLSIPARTTVEEARQSLRLRFPGIVADANHLYEPSQAAAAATPAAASLRNGSLARAMMNWPQVQDSCGKGIKIGMIDGQVDTTHPAFAGRSVEARSFTDPKKPQGAASHGTAVAALLIGAPADKGFGGILPGAKLYAANMFEEDNGKTAGSALALVKALDWLMTEKVNVVNLSIAGADNTLLKLAIEKARRSGMALVASVGNDASDEPAFPAAFDGVVGVTAINDQRLVYEKANRGDYVDLAAPGVRVWTAVPGGGKYQSGTSFAAPFISALVAMDAAKGQSIEKSAVLARYGTKAIDLGPPGRDKIFGFGLVNAAPAC